MKFGFRFARSLIEQAGERGAAHLRRAHERRTISPGALNDRNVAAWLERALTPGIGLIAPPGPTSLHPGRWLNPVLPNSKLKINTGPA